MDLQKLNAAMMETHHALFNQVSTVPARTIDDTLLWDESIESTSWYTLEYITHCSRNGIVFNPDKFQFAGDKVEFASFLMADGIKPFSISWLPQISQVSSSDLG